MRLNKNFIAGFFACCAHVAIAQLSLPNEIILTNRTPLAPYLFPINPGRTNFLAGTMGELRNTHFHAGIDVRTQSMIGLPVLATQEGYVSRVVVSAYGYGNLIMLTHPDGNTSLYAHLEKFKGNLAQHVLEEQYNRKTFDLALDFDSRQFPVQRGDTIAYSGNTGASMGPHLHFEIRNANNEALNPLSFGFTEVLDNFAPIAMSVALVTMDKDARVNDRFGRFEFALLKSGKNYRLPQPIFAKGNIGVEILAHDKLDLSQFRCGINEIEMTVDSVRIFRQQIEKFNFEDSYDIATLMNFKTLKTKGARFNKLYLSDGNPLKFYSDVVSKGIINVVNGQRKIDITLRDFSGNTTKVNFRLKSTPTAKEVRLLESMKKAVEYEIIENTLVFRSRPCANDKARLANVYFSGTKTNLAPSYFNQGRNVYLIDLRRSLPDSIQSCAGSVKLHLKQMIPSGIDFDYYGERAEVNFKKGNLYDTLYLSANHEVTGKTREVFSIGTLTTPIHSAISIALQPTLAYPNPTQTFAYHLEGNRLEFVGGEWMNGRIQFATKELGDFTILADSIPPSIGRIYCTNKTARFRIADNLSGIAKFEASVNGEWLLMKYDYKTGILQSEKLDPQKILQGDFQLKVTDRAGNEKIFTQKIL